MLPYGFQSFLKRIEADIDAENWANILVKAHNYRPDDSTYLIALLKLLGESISTIYRTADDVFDLIVNNYFLFHEAHNHVWRLRSAYQWERMVLFFRILMYAIDRKEWSEADVASALVAYMRKVEKQSNFVFVFVRATSGATYYQQDHAREIFNKELRYDAERHAYYAF